MLEGKIKIHIYNLIVDLVSVRRIILLAEFQVCIVILTSRVITYCGHRRATQKYNKENKIEDL